MLRCMRIQANGFAEVRNPLCVRPGGDAANVVFKSIQPHRGRAVDEALPIDRNGGLDCMQ